MVKVKRQFVFLTFLTSGAAAILSLVALGTDQWIVSGGLFEGVDEDIQENDIHYGMFSGLYRQVLGSGSGTTYKLTMTCSFGDNACAMLCKETSELRSAELALLISGEKVEFDNNCPRVDASTSVATNYQKKLLNVSNINLNTRDDGNESNSTGDTKIFISAGSFLCTLLFLILSAGFGLLAAALAVWNTGGNPYQNYFSIFAMYIYNGLAAFFIAIDICIWGGEFGVNLSENVAILYTITGQMDTSGKSGLGFSYWINMGSFFLYLISIFLLWFRQYRINREPEMKIELEETNDNTIILY